MQNAGKQGERLSLLHICESGVAGWGGVSKRQKQTWDSQMQGGHFWDLHGNKLNINMYLWKSRKINYSLAVQWYQEAINHFSCDVIISLHLRVQIWGDMDGGFKGEA